MITFQQVSKKYPSSTTAVADINLEIPDGQFLFVVGPSGAGKSTLLKLIIREEIPTEGKIFVDELDVTKLPNRKVPHLRRRIGTIFQDFKLLSKKTVFENVAFALEIIGRPESEIKETTREVLDLVGLKDKQNLFPHQISGGEAQRVAIARAVVQKPMFVLADEPTGNLDAKSAWEIMALLQKLNELGTTVIMATHNADIVQTLPHRVVEIEHGKIIKDSEIKGKK
ncbi:MAG: cell division ATP-binding protein FtsE [Patescibacteria group bacterium]|nr:cell division ATP-binding protein FtsE [Patescibacteria group bacterium]